MFKGVAASPGITIGRALVIDQAEVQVRKTRVPESQVEEELGRLELAVAATRQEIEAVKQKVAEEVGPKEAEIFNAYLHILDDPLLIAASKERVRKERCNAEYTLQQVAAGLAKQFTDSADEYLQERAADLNDVVARLVRNLTGQPSARVAEIKDEVVVVAKDLAPSQTAAMRRERVLGFATDAGGRTSHVAIMARSLEIPAVVGMKDITQRVATGDLLVVDGSSGTVHVNPDAKTLEKFRQAQIKMQQTARKLKKWNTLNAVTLDGYRLQVAANLELPQEVHQAVKYGAEGIGLFRTEFLYLNRAELPTEDEQFEAYKLVAQKCLPYATIIRTLDLGGDKIASRLGGGREANPFLGLRAIRLCLANVDLFKVQLRAILRASNFGKVKIMFPLISDVEEFRRACAVVDEVRQELVKRRVPFDKSVETGSMIELPSAAVTADALAKEADFFSIGTNDLIQYTLAADRVNEKVAYLYNPLHPAILRLIKTVVEAGRAERIWTGMCGEMASDPALAPLLVGLGLDEFSTGPAFVPQIKKAIRETTFAKARELAQAALACATTAEVEAILERSGGA
jgi:phosphoenolpyruvate-protein phosphotransferase (PTS system enzyme I)